MSPSNDRVSDGDQRRARQVIDQALASGRIIQADHEKRIEQVGNAQSTDELRMLTHDLDRAVMFGGAIESPSPVAPAPPPPPSPTPTLVPTPGAATPVPVPVAPVAPQTTTTVPYGPPAGMSQESLTQTEAAVSAASKSGRSWLGCLIPLVVVIVVFVVPAVTFFSEVKGVWDDVQEAFDSASDNPGGPFGEPEHEDPDVLSVDGWNDLVSALEAKTGGSQAFSAVLYPTYAVVSTPVDRSSGRTQSYYWDGELSDSGTKGTTTTARFDLRDIRPAALVRLVSKARKLVEDPSSWYAILQPPDFEGTSIMAYAVNDFGETVYISATADGKIVRRYDSTNP